MLRQFQVFAAAPGRHDEAEARLREWLAAVRAAPQFRGGAVLREYAGEFGPIEGALAVTYDVETREDGKAFRAATAHIANPMAQDSAGQEPADQGAILFAAPHVHAADGGHHGHDHDAHVNLEYDRGGGLLARLMHGHFAVVADVVDDPTNGR